MQLKFLLLTIFLLANTISEKAVAVFKEKYKMQVENMQTINITIIDVDACSKCASARLINHLEKLSFFLNSKSIILIPNKRKIEIDKYVKEEVGISNELLEKLIVISDSEMIELFKKDADEDHGSIFFLSYQNEELTNYITYSDLGKNIATKSKHNNKPSTVENQHSFVK